MLLKTVHVLVVLTHVGIALINQVPATLGSPKKNGCRQELDPRQGLRSGPLVWDDARDGPHTKENQPGRHVQHLYAERDENDVCPKTKGRNSHVFPTLVPLQRAFLVVIPCELSFASVCAPASGTPRIAPIGSSKQGQGDGINEDNL